MRRIAAGGTALDALTTREMEVLAQMAQGRSNSGIAGALMVSESAVAKHVNGGATQTRFESLEGKARTEELARMLGGVQITAQTRAHAQEMLKRASRM